MCSDTTRNGKTLLARLLADLLSLRRANNPLVFDIDLSGNGIFNWFPDKTKVIDLSRVSDQVVLFDTLLGQNKHLTQSDNAADIPNDVPRDFVVDVPANELNRFFQIFSDIGFERGAYEAQLDVRIYHILNWTFKSLQTAQNIRSGLQSSKFIAVRNLAIEALPFTPDPHEEGQVPNIEIDLYLNALSPDSFRLINDHNFSFARFVSGEMDELDYQIKTDIWNFLEDVHNQINTPIS